MLQVRELVAPGGTWNSGWEQPQLRGSLPWRGTPGTLLGHGASRLSHLAQDPAVTPDTCQALHGPRDDDDDDDDEGMGCSWSEHWGWVLTWNRTGRIWPCVRGVRMQRNCYIFIPNVPQPQLQRCWRERLTFLWS